MKRITSFVPTHPMYSTVRRAGTEACPYDWLFKIRKALDRTGGQHLISHPVRADAAVRPYAEDLSIDAKSAIVGWRFKSRNRLCRSRLPRLPARFDDQHVQTNGRVVTSKPSQWEEEAALTYTDLLDYADWKTSTPSASAAARSCLSSDASLAPRVRAQWIYAAS